MRRLIRDQERTQQAVDAIIGDISRVFPMRNIYGKKQEKQAAILIHNDYEILEQKGEKHNFQPTKLSKSECGELQKREYYIDYEYNDSKEENGRIVVSEVYKSYKQDLSYVVVSKQKTYNENGQETVTTISMKSTQLGIITQLHTLMQLAGLTLQKVSKKSISTYQKEDKECLVKEKRGKMFIASQKRHT